jgi:hypothetical protein
MRIKVDSDISFPVKGGSPEEILKDIFCLFQDNELIEEDLQFNEWLDVFHEGPYADQIEAAYQYFIESGVLA